MNLSTDHLEHVLPVLAELGLASVLPLLRPGAEKDPDAISGAIVGLATGAQKRTLRHLVAISKASGEEILAWEENPDSLERALKAAAVSDLSDSVTAVKDFFFSLRHYLPSIQGSSETGDPGEMGVAAKESASALAP